MEKKGRHPGASRNPGDELPHSLFRERTGARGIEKWNSEFQALITPTPTQNKPRRGHSQR